MPSMGEGGYLLTVGLRVSHRQRGIILERDRYLECLDSLTRIVHISSVGTLLSGMASHSDSFLGQGFQSCAH